MKHRSRNSTRSFEHRAEFCFNGELNDFLLPGQRHQSLSYCFNGHPGIKDPIEVFGVPHPEVDSILVNGVSVGFAYQLQNGDRVAVYPAVGGMSSDSAIKLREAPQQPFAFVVDVNLGKLAKLLRLLGFDTLYGNAFDDKEIVELSTAQKRIVLTRDRRLLHARKIAHGYWVRSVLPQQQLTEVVSRYQLAGLIRPFERCASCNGFIDAVAKQQILHLLEPKTKQYYDLFFRCRDCGKVYWQGSHVDHVKIRFAQYLQ